MKMIEDENVDLVVDVGDFDYWGRCTETYELTNMTIIESLTGDNVELPKKAKLKRVKWQDGKYGDIKGWKACGPVSEPNPPAAVRASC